MATKITKNIKEKFGTLKFYAKKRGINYGSLKLATSGQYQTTKIIKILKKDGFIKKMS